MEAKLDIHIMAATLPMFPSRVKRVTQQESTAVVRVLFPVCTSRRTSSNRVPIPRARGRRASLRQDGVPGRARIGGMPAEGGRSGLRG